MKITIYTEVGKNIGYGHLDRALTIQKYFSHIGWNVEILLRDYDNLYTNKLPTKIIPIKNLNILKKFSLLYKTNTVIFDTSHKFIVNNKAYLQDLQELINILRNRNIKTIVFDGINRFDSIHKNIETKANYIIVPYPIIGFNYKLSKANKFLYGLEYFIYSPYILDLCKETPTKKHYITISFGGGNVKEDNRRIFNVLYKTQAFKVFKDYKFIFINNDIDNFQNKVPNVEILPMLKKNEFLKILHNSLIAFTSIGSTKYEALALNIPVIVYSKNNLMKKFHKFLENKYRLWYVGKNEEYKIVNLLQKNINQPKLTINNNIDCRGIYRLKKIIEEDIS